MSYVGTIDSSNEGSRSNVSAKSEGGSVFVTLMLMFSLIFGAIIVVFAPYGTVPVEDHGAEEMVEVLRVTTETFGQFEELARVTEIFADEIDTQNLDMDPGDSDIDGLYRSISEIEASNAPAFKPSYAPRYARFFNDGGAYILVTGNGSVWVYGAIFKEYGLVNVLYTNTNVNFQWNVKYKFPDGKRYIDIGPFKGRAEDLGPALNKQLNQLGFSWPTGYSKHHSSVTNGHIEGIPLPIHSFFTHKGGIWGYVNNCSD